MSSPSMELVTSMVIWYFLPLAKLMDCTVGVLPTSIPWGSLALKLKTDPTSAFEEFNS